MTLFGFWDSLRWVTWEDVVAHGVGASEEKPLDFSLPRCLYGPNSQLLQVVKQVSVAQGEVVHSVKIDFVEQRSAEVPEHLLGGSGSGSTSLDVVPSCRRNSATFCVRWCQARR